MGGIVNGIIKFNVTKADLENYEKFRAEIEDYPVYAHTGGLTRTEMILLAKLMKYQYEDRIEYDVTIKVRPRKETQREKLESGNAKDTTSAVQS